MNSTQLQLLGHASFKVTTPEGRIILVDPWIADNPAIPNDLKTIDKVDLILVTHGHEDHMDPDLPALLEKWNAKVVVNPIVRWYLLGKGVPANRIEAMNLGGTISFFDLKVSMVNAFHIAHIPLSATEIGFPHSTVGFVIKLSDNISIYFAGDTSVFTDMKVIGDIYKPDIAVLPIGDRFTMGPLEAAYAIRLLNVKHVVPFHYGTWPMLAGTPEELKELTNDIADLHIYALKAGEALNTHF
ncbi:metal-dependent hydrolase [Solitalea canadensis]|uniref:Putative Zn-dependent hydrolase of beta-lactamase fold protein n=1 Tax=Solitalea canadensis (strain ATCC 29591 / DSM 3403 / JCM 21819 / LMG 8368 / NBRC 15130 / NCIMB 12057 / USAM 9D) TaxID=929556 RepID=H8KSX6_SOLCM|nr:metal-dependent hydrolase [Solitalea canadensis]AFD05436.1 putative Zn-dependent hydrolase of beta-lactamase fold protein [Solitalea canadensis DSM 3403]